MLYVMKRGGIAVVMVIMAAMLLGGLGGCAVKDPGTLTVKVDRPGVTISPMLYGLMTEEINHSYDGGLYGELVQNRIFKDNAKEPAHWSVVKSPEASGSIALDTADPVNTVALTTSLRVEIGSVGQGGGGGRVGVANDGYWGIPVKAGTEYRVSFYAKSGGGFSGPLTVSLESDDGKSVHATGRVAEIGTSWKQYTVMLKTGWLVESVKNRLVITGGTKGTVWFNLVSLFGPTFNNRPNGNRIDLMELLGGMKPAFLRFPGGNYLEGNTIEERFAWEKTIGPLDQRPGHQCPWGYRSTDGMGLLEFLEWCEDLKMEPVLAVFAGYALQGQRVMGPALEPHIQEALDEIEYVTGDRSTKWGAVRAKDGHPEPFKLTYVEIGNEDQFDREQGSYDRRFTQLFDVIRAKYPNLKLIATAPVRTRTPDVIDDHYYRSARDMMLDVKHYDTTDRKGPKIFVGEWATTEGSPTPTLNAAIGDAAWMTGMERNSDVVVMSCYAPLLVNVNPDARQWGTNLIGYNAMKSYGSTSYWAQRMFAENRGDTVLPVEIKAQRVPQYEAPPMPRGGVGVGTWATKAEYKEIRVVQGEKTVWESDFSKGTAGWTLGQGDWKASEGMLAQGSENTDCRAWTGNASWTDYTVTLKARKISGAEGFLVLFHVRDSGNYLWWNVGGWTNTRTAIEAAENGAKRQIGPASDVTVETGRWYDVRIELRGRTIKCYLDGKLVTEATDEPSKPVTEMFATASRDEKSGDVIVKVVNPLELSQVLRVDLQGVGTVKWATLEVLSGQPLDVNSIEEPEKVAPKKQVVWGVGPTYDQEFPAYSVSILRVKTR